MHTLVDRPCRHCRILIESPLNTSHKISSGHFEQILAAYRYSPVQLNLTKFCAGQTTDTQNDLNIFTNFMITFGTSKTFGDLQMANQIFIQYHKWNQHLTRYWNQTTLKYQSAYISWHIKFSPYANAHQQACRHDLLHGKLCNQGVVSCGSPRL